ncbi:MAG: DUF3494 domain-containing protein [Lewinellaceae bacterium]|nr:DUF3494 domain-containing protein [Lewinellaceae bacterium]
MLIFGQAPDLGTSNNFALFTAAGQFENVGAATVVIGDVGTNVGAFLAFPPGTLVGSIHVADPVTVQAKIDVDDAYADLAGRTCGSTIGSTLGNGQILAPNTYCVGEASTLNGNLTLDAQGDPDAIFIFQIGGAFATSTLANVLLINGANLCNVYWQIDGAFTLGGGSLFVGTIIANGAINLHTGSTLNGRALSTAGAISTSDNFVTMSLCQPPIIICAGEVLVSCDNLVPAPDITSVSVTATCPGNYTVTFLSDVSTNEICPNQYTLTRTYLVTDACGETATCEQTILVDDQILPIFTNCPVAPIALGCNPPPNTAQAIAAAGPATDNCGVPVLSAIGGLITGGGCVQSQTWTVTATDACNNMASCLVTFTWNSDAQNPTFTNCPAGPINLGCNPVLPTTASAIAAAGAATDDCGAPAISAVGGIITGECVQSQTWTVTATDVCNNTATCLVSFTWSLDTQDPVFTNCPTGPTILGCTPNPPTVANAITAAGPATDNCGTPVVSASGGVITGGCVQSQIWTVTATDICNNTATCLVTFTWSNSDAAPPAFINCPTGPINLGCDPALLPTAASAILAAGPATDDCGDPVISAVGGIITGGCVKSQIWTVTATDICNSAATCVITFTWTSDTQPMIVDIPDYTLPGCTNPAWPTALTTIWTDNCGGGGNVVAVAGPITTNGCSQSRVYTFTVVGVCGAPDVETTIVTRTYDVTKPIFTSIPPNVTVQCDAVPPLSVAPIATDNCDPSVTFTLLETRVNGACPDTYTLTRRWTAIDDCGNTRTASQRITVRDTQKPVFTSVPGNVTIQCTDPIPVLVLPTATDNCDASVTVTLLGQWIMNTTCPGNYQIMRSWSAVDNCGNSTVAAQIIQVQDKQAPTFTNVPPSVTLECNQSVPPLSNSTATDNCGGYVQVTYLGQVRTNGSCLYNFTLTRTWRAQDLCGNSTIAIQVITVQDSQPPVFVNPPADITAECECYCVPFPIALAIDNCGPATVAYQGEVQSPGDCSTGFTLTRTWIASDLCGQTSIHTQVIYLCDVLPLMPPASEERENAVANEPPREFLLRPNPTSDKVQIDLSLFNGEAVQIVIFNEIGALVWDQQLKPVQEGFLEINLRQHASLKDGVYQVVLQSGGKQYVKSLVLMH